MIPVLQRFHVVFGELSLNFLLSDTYWNNQLFNPLQPAGFDSAQHDRLPIRRVANMNDERSLETTCGVL
jgi:hypothetical protein